MPNWNPKNPAKHWTSEKQEQREENKGNEKGKKDE